MEGKYLFLSIWQHFLLIIKDRAWNDLELRIFSEKEKIWLPWWLFFSLVFVCNFEKGEMGRGSLCDSFVMDADGEWFLFVSLPLDYKMKTPLFTKFYFCCQIHLTLFNYNK